MKSFIIVGIFILFDVLSGFLKAWYLGKIDSTKLRNGLFHKLSEILALVGCAVLEHGIQFINLNVGIPVLSVVTAYICVMEVISFIENLCEINPNLSKLFKPYLNKLKGGKDDNEKGN